MPTVQRGGVVKRLQIEMVVLVALGIWCMWLQLASSLQSSFFFLWNRKSIQNICHSAKKKKKKNLSFWQFSKRNNRETFRLPCLIYLFAKLGFGIISFSNYLLNTLHLEHAREKEHKHYF